MGEVTNHADIGISCSDCGASFTGQAKYYEELINMFLRHWKELHD